MGLSLFSKKRINVFNAALASDDLATFIDLTKTNLSLEAVFESTSIEKNWLTLAFKNKKIAFITAFFDHRPPFTREEVAALTPMAIDTLLNTFEAALHHPRLYHTVEGLLKTAILPIMKHMPEAHALQTKLNDIYYPNLLKALSFVSVSPFQKTVPQTKSTQLLGLLMKHGFIAHYTLTPNPDKVTVDFKGCANTGLRPATVKITRANQPQDYAYYANAAYLLQDNEAKKNPELLLCHHYFHLKQEAIACKNDRQVFEKKLDEFIEILTLISESEHPAQAVKDYIETVCAAKTGHSDLRDTLYPLASMSDDALRQAHATYRNHINTPVLNKENLLNALYRIRSNPFTRINEYLENKNAKHFERKKTLFEGIQQRIEAIKNDPNNIEVINAFRDFIKENLYTSKPQTVSAPQVKSVTPAHTAWPHRGEFADLIRPLKHWDTDELVIKFDQFKATLETQFQEEAEERPKHARGRRK